MSLDVEYIIGIAATVVGIVAATVVFVALKYRVRGDTEAAWRVRRDAALATMKGALAVGMLVPQLVKNHQIGRDMDDAVTPFFPAIGPIIMFLGVPFEHDLLVSEARKQNHYTVVVIITFHTVLHIGFVFWVFQYAAFTRNDTVRIVFYALGGLYSLGLLGVLMWVYHVITSALYGRQANGGTTVVERVFSFDALTSDEEATDDDSDSDDDAVEQSGLLEHAL
jgi:hypothetical protein